MPAISCALEVVFPLRSLLLSPGGIRDRWRDRGLWMLLLAEVAQSDTDKAKEPVRTQIDALSQRECNRCYLFAGSGRSRGCVTAGMDVETLSSSASARPSARCATRALKLTRPFQRVAGSGVRFRKAACLARMCLRLRSILWVCPELRDCDRYRARTRAGGRHSARNEFRA